MFVKTHKLQKGKKARSAVVVGAGIVGLSVARELARKGVHVTVVEREERAGSVATAKSWAWLNANGKQPLEYQQFSMMAMVRYRFPSNPACTRSFALVMDAPLHSFSLP